MRTIWKATFLMKQSRRLKEMESKQEGYKDQFTPWRPFENVLSDNESLHYYVFCGVDPDKISKMWIYMAHEIGKINRNNTNYVKAKKRFKK